ncbi:MAG: tetratricopeptide repeat protein [Gammaproteobacteria bacterium]|nr:tetratricopeptide repeat protein [Gammaproteobacteria bacterium]
MNADEALQLAWQHQQAGRFPQARAVYQQLLQEQPEHPVALHRLGVLAQSAGRHDIAADLIARAIRVNPADPDYHYGLGVSHAVQGRIDAAIECFGRALELRPDHVEAHLGLGNLQLQRGRPDEAAECYRRALRGDPASAAARYNLGLACFRTGRLDEAAECYRTVLALQPDFAEANLNLGITLSSQGRLDEALHYLQQALALLPDNAIAHYNLGLTLLNLGRPDEAAARLQRALALDPEHAEACLNLANALIELGRLDEALAAARKAVALRPDSAEAQLTLGRVLHSQGRLDESAACNERAIALKPDFAEAYSNLANTYLDLGRLDEALRCCRKTIDLEPGFAAAHYNLGLVFFRQHRLDDAVASYRAAIALKPDYVEAHANLGTALTYLGRADEAMRSIDEALRLNPDSDGAHSARLFTMQYLPDTTPAASFAAHREFAARCEAPLRPHWRAHANPRDPERRLRIGYVSPDFRRHSVATFIEPVLARHDRARFEVFCYYNNTERDAVTERIAALADHWLTCAAYTDERLAEQIRADGIDILVDLAGHTSGHRLLTFARRPAPVQVTYLGYPATTGLSAMDYRLCTADTDPPGQESFHSEALYRLPRTLWCYRPLAGRAPDAGTPALRNGQVTFGSMNNLAKISPGSVKCWAEILRAVPGSHLVMTSVPEGTVRAALRDRFAAHDVDAGRVHLHGKLAYAEYWNLLRDIDIALDPFPYAGTTTTCETLWTGIPVVTLTGQTSVARSGYALLKAVGLEELAAHDAGDYVRIAVDLARDIPRLARLRRELPARFDASPLRDEAAFTRDLEAACRDMWRAWCGQAPAQRAHTGRDAIAALLREGNEQLAQGRMDAAASRFEAAYALTPDTHEDLLALGIAFYRLGRLDASTAAFERALALRPDSAEACHNLGTAYMDQGRLALAAGCFQKAIELRPDSAIPHYNLAMIRFRQGDIDEAVACNRRALALKPDFVKAQNNLGVALAYQGRTREALHCYDEALRLHPDYANALSSRLCAMNRLADITPEARFAAHRQFAERCEAPLRPRWRAHANVRDAERRLRIGYVSSDFRRHSVASFMEPVLARHDRAQVEVFCYYNHTVRDETTARLRALADRWLECGRLQDDDLAERIRQDGIDILVDLNGHTDGNRLLTFARRPAPVQVTYLGYPATTGLTAMDYRLCTADTDPPGQEAFHSEALYRLPRTLWCYQPPGERPAGGAASPPLQAGSVTFGSMNTYPKISPEAFALWMDVLRALPAAHLVMTGVPEGSVRAALAERVAAHGIEAARVRVHTRLSEAEYRGVLGGIDIALDPFPYNGTTTTCETLWMGIPVITLSGLSSVARSGHALLKTVGLEELVAVDAADYVRRAVELARDAGRLARLRQELPRRFDASPLRDEAAFARDLEAACRDMWRRWCRAQAEPRG